MGAKPTSRSYQTQHSPVATPMLLVRAPPSPAPLSAAANFPADLERPLRLRGLSSSRAGVTTATAAAKPAASTLGGQKRKQVTSVANPLVKHCVKLRLSAAYRRSCRRLLLVGLAPILYSAAPGPCHPTCPASLLFLNLCFCPLLQGGV